jgi:MFS family permease
MQSNKELSTFTLLLLISFPGVNAVLFTPALPDLAHFFAITSDAAQQTITLFLVGYAFGQLLYGPLANRFGRKPAMFGGIVLQIIGSLLCVASGLMHAFSLLVASRFLLALGSGVGLNLTFTMVNEHYHPDVARKKMSYLIMAFAIMPGVGVALGGLLNRYSGWIACFYAGALYGLLLLVLVSRLPETAKTLNREALTFTNLRRGYGCQFKNPRLIAGGLVMGFAGACLYVFAAEAPFVAIQLYGQSSSEYGFANLLPSVGLLAGSLFSASYSVSNTGRAAIRLGLTLKLASGLILLLAGFVFHSAWLAIFVPMILLYFSTAFIFANASSVAMHEVADISNASAVMSFINMGLVTLIVLSLQFYPTSSHLMPILFIFFACASSAVYYRWLRCP